MGLRRTKSPPLNARVSPQSPHTFPTPPPRQTGRINHTPTSKQIMGPKSNTHKRTTTHQSLTRQGNYSSKRSAEFFSFWQGQLMVDYSHPSVLLRPNRQTQRKHQWSCARNFWISWQHKRKPYSPSVQATWSSQFTATRNTSPNPNRAAELEATCSWQDTEKSQSTMGQSSTSPK